MRQIIDRLRGFRCSEMEAWILHYHRVGLGVGQPDVRELDAIRRNPDPDALARLRRHLHPQYLTDRP